MTTACLHGIVPFFFCFYFIQGRVLVLGILVPRGGALSLPSVRALVLGVPGIEDVLHRAFHCSSVSCLQALMSWTELLGGNQKMGRRKILRLGHGRVWDGMRI
jgi:hypothetical protein